jgi:phage FluMu protein Com
MFNGPNDLFCVRCGAQLTGTTREKDFKAESLKKEYAVWETEKLKHAVTVERGEYDGYAVGLMEEELKNRNEFLPLKCPRCGVMNPHLTARCACGYDSSEPLPYQDVKCPHCGTELELNETERIQKHFLCPECKMAVDMAEHAGATDIQQSVERKPTVRLLKANRKIVGVSWCKICNQRFVLGVDLKQCGNCLSYAHSKCWDEYGGCNQLGCREETKLCPGCGREIRKSALKCRHCGQYVDERIRIASGPKRQLKEASTALTCSIIGIFCFGIILGPVAVYNGVKALNMIQNDPQYEGRGKAIAGIIIGSIEILLTVIYVAGLIAQS